MPIRLRIRFSRNSLIIMVREQVIWIFLTKIKDVSFCEVWEVQSSEIKIQAEGIP